MERVGKVHIRDCPFKKGRPQVKHRTHASPKAMLISSHYSLGAEQQLVVDAESAADADDRSPMIFDRGLAILELLSPMHTRLHTFPGTTHMLRVNESYLISHHSVCVDTRIRDDTTLIRLANFFHHHLHCQVVCTYLGTLYSLGH